MPELPEVETVVRDLHPLLIGRRLTSVAVSRFALRSRWSPEWEPQLVGRRVTAVERRGKWIILALDDGRQLLFHLGMTGQLRVTPATAPVPPHTHIVIHLDDGQELRFTDIRRFGSARLFANRADLDAFFDRSQLGPEPFVLDPRYWRDALAGTKRCLKAVLLDQRVVAGVGNIYADESLFEARLHPKRLACQLSAPEMGRLRRAVATVLNRAIHKRGSSIRNYVGGSGLKGEYQQEFRVYGRAGERCPRRCRGLIQCIRLAGRATHFCPRCQPEEG